MPETVSTTPSENHNVLVGLQCPACGNRDVFEIVVTARAIVFDSGVDSYSDAEWDGASPIQCTQCSREGLVAEFTTTSADELAQVLKRLEESVSTAEASTIEIDTDLAVELIRLAREKQILP